MAPSDKPVGGIKGFLMKAGQSFMTGGLVARDWSWWLAQKGGRIGLVLASTSMVILMPLIFEINREVTVRRRQSGVFESRLLWISFSFKFCVLSLSLSKTNKQTDDCRGTCTSSGVAQSGSQ
jgi:hypothetical protein